MPKRSRQAHIPSQQIRKRKVRRPFGAAEPLYEPSEPVFAEEPISSLGVAPFGASGPVDTQPRVQPRVGRRMELVTRSREQVSVRVIPGQLPTFERSYLLTELRRIAMISSALLAVIILLTVLMR